MYQSRSYSTTEYVRLFVFNPSYGMVRLCEMEFAEMGDENVNALNFTFLLQKSSQNGMLKIVMAHFKITMKSLFFRHPALIRPWKNVRLFVFLPTG